MTAEQLRVDVDAFPLPGPFEDSKKNGDVVAVGLLTTPEPLSTPELYRGP